MKRLLLLLAAVFMPAIVAIVLPAIAVAQSGIKRTSTYYGYAMYTGAGAVVQTSTTPTNGVTLPTTRPDGTSGRPKYAVFTVEGGTARWIDAGSVTPTATVGTPLSGELDYDGDLVNIKFFLPTGATLHVAYYE